MNPDVAESDLATAGFDTVAVTILKREYKCIKVGVLGIPFERVFDQFFHQGEIDIVPLRIGFRQNIVYGECQ